MGVFVPSYYLSFACTADLCRHTCCKGWEIDIDADTYAKYKRIPGAFGKKLSEGIFEDEDGAHFILDNEERCPFLNQRNLCDIILELGEDSLCQICADHPRFRNFFDSRTEIGLGIACESACNLILDYDKKPEMICIEEDEICVEEEEQKFFALREEILDIVFEDKPVIDCMNKLAEKFSLSLSEPDSYKGLYDSLENLHPDWKIKISNFSNAKTDFIADDMQVRQLLAYFVFRHLADYFFEDRLCTGIAFSIHATQMILALSQDKVDFQETARQYSEEIEYSAENVERILLFLEKENV